MVNWRLRTGFVLSLLLEELESVNANKNVAVGINFEEVAIERVKPETTNGECRVVLEQKDFWNGWNFIRFLKAICLLFLSTVSSNNKKTLLKKM